MNVCPFKTEGWITLSQERFLGEPKVSDQTFKGKQESDIGRKERGLSLAGERGKAGLDAGSGTAQALGRLVGGRPEQAEGL